MNKNHWSSRPLYLNFYRLDAFPFSLTPDTEFFLEYGEFKQALEVVNYALSTGEGITKICGEVGTGKTLLAYKIKSSLDAQHQAILITNTAINSKNLTICIAKELGIKNARKIGRQRLIERIHNRLLALQAENKKVTLLIDEAQSLPVDSFDSLRIFSNLETEKSKLFNIVLFGQPELDTILQDKQFRQIRQRIVFSHEIQPLTPEALEIYIDYRLHIAGYRGQSLFSKRALQKLHSASQGIPRMVNILGHKALLMAYAMNDQSVGLEHVKKAAMDTDDAVIDSSWLDTRGSFLTIKGYFDPRYRKLGTE